MKYLKVFTDFARDIEELGDAECGRLFRAMMKYAESKTDTELKGNERFYWSMAKRNIDTTRELYEKKVSRMDNARHNINYQSNISAEMSNNSLIIAKDKDKDKEKDNKEKDNTIVLSKKKAFSPPSLAEIKAYCVSRQNEVDAERFYDYYTANGWKVGKNPMKDWRAAVRTWERSTDKSKQESRFDAIRRYMDKVGEEYDDDEIGNVRVHLIDDFALD